LHAYSNKENNSVINLINNILFYDYTKIQFFYLETVTFYLLLTFFLRIIILVYVWFASKESR